MSLFFFKNIFLQNEKKNSSFYLYINLDFLLQRMSSITGNSSASLNTIRCCIIALVGTEEIRKNEFFKKKKFYFNMEENKTNTGQNKL